MFAPVFVLVSVLMLSAVWKVATVLGCRPCSSTLKVRIDSYGRSGTVETSIGHSMTVFRFVAGLIISN